jgi:hypothetical protein
VFPVVTPGGKTPGVDSTIIVGEDCRTIVEAVGQNVDAGGLVLIGVEINLDESVFCSSGKMLSSVFTRGTGVTIGVGAMDVVEDAEAVRMSSIGVCLEYKCVSIALIIADSERDKQGLIG